MISLRYHGAAIRETAVGTWQIDLCSGGRRIRQTFQTLQHARNAVDILVMELATDNEPVTPADVAMLRRARDLLPHDVTILDAAEYYVDMHRRVEQPMTLPEAHEAYITSMKQMGRRPKTIQDAQARVGKFCLRHPDTGMHEVGAQDIRAWVDEIGARPINRNNYVRALSGFFSWGVDYGHCATNPCSVIKQVSVTTGDPVIFTVSAVRTWLAHVAKHSPDLVPYYALGFFAGIRSSELAAMTADHVHSGAVHVTADIAKMRRRRIVEMEPNLAAWLEAHPPGARIRPHPSRQHWEAQRAMAAASGVTWVKNGMRHSFASYHLAAYRDAARTAHDLGHPNASLLMSVYRNLVTVEDGEKYFAILPELLNDQTPPDY